MDLSLYFNVTTCSQFFRRLWEKIHPYEFCWYENDKKCYSNERCKGTREAIYFSWTRFTENNTKASLKQIVWISLLGVSCLRCNKPWKLYGSLVGLSFTYFKATTTMTRQISFNRKVSKNSWNFIIIVRRMIVKVEYGAFISLYRFENILLIGNLWSREDVTYSRLWYHEDVALAINRTQENSITTHLLICASLNKN